MNLFKMKNLFNLFLLFLLFSACGQEVENKQAISTQTHPTAEQVTDNTKPDPNRIKESKPKAEDLRLYGKIEWLETAKCSKTLHLTNMGNEPLFFTLAWQKSDGSFGFLQERCIYPKSKIAFKEKCLGETIKSASVKEARRPTSDEKVLDCD